MRYITKIIAITLLLWTVTYAAVPHLINYQGRLTDASGSPLNGAYNLTFRIYDAETAGNLLWEETQSGVVIQKGIFSVLLGSVTNLNLAFDKPYFLEIKVGNEVMSPRQRITSAGYAIRAEKAEDANTIVNVGVSATPAANKLLPLDNNAKLPSIALKVYDSGWFDVTNGLTYTLTHNFNFSAPYSKMIITILAAQPDTYGGTITARTISSFGNLFGGAYGATVTHFSANTFTVIIGGQGVGVIDNNGTANYFSNGKIRVLALALE